MQMLRSAIAAMLLVLPLWIQAQVLDFDAVCASPPCNLNNQYSAFGITFVPNLTTSAQIVAGGTDGLTGTSGARYVRVSNPPTQLLINLSPVATFIQLDASRAASSSGTVTLSISFFKLGAQVGTTQNVTLTTVNTWTTFSFTNAGGFDQVLLDPSGGATNTFGIDNVHFGGRCYGFSDVATSSNYCNAVEWLANRGVTLGCATGLYCPNDNVSRSQMALFMNRLGNAITPQVFAISGSLPGAWITNPTPETDMCIIGPIRVDTPKTAVVHGNIAVRTTGAMNLWVVPRMATDAGGFGYISGFYDIGGTTGAADVDVSTFSDTVALAGGHTYRFSVDGHRDSGAGGVSFGSCKIQVQLYDRNTGSAPFDTQPAGGSDAPNATR